MFRQLAVSASLVLFFSLPAVAGEEIVTTSEDQRGVSLTIYNSDLALVRDLRKIELPAGSYTLAFKEISSRIMPETALLRGGDVDVLEQNFEFDLLTPTALLSKYVGRDVTLVRNNAATGVETTVSARVLSTANGVVLQVGNQIETEVDGRLVYPDVPSNLRDRPTLTMLIDGGISGEQELELSYLTGGLSWKADYVAELNEQEDRINLNGWVTLTNSSGATYRDSRLQLVAGEVNREQHLPTMPMMAADFAEAAPRGAVRKMTTEPMFEYHLYTVARATTIKENQSKQIALLQENDGICRKELVLQGREPYYYWSRTGEISRKENVEVFLEMVNSKESNFGLPKPAGIVRVYKKDSSGYSQFVGEDGIDHTPENEIIRIKLGKAFDVTAERIQTDYKELQALVKERRLYESEYAITLKNGKSEEVTVKIEENIPGTWQIISESALHLKENAATVSWTVTVPAKGSNKLVYRVRTEI